MTPGRLPGGSQRGRCVRRRGWGTCGPILGTRLPHASSFHRGLAPPDDLGVSGWGWCGTGHSWGHKAVLSSAGSPGGRLSSSSAGVGLCMLSSAWLAGPHRGPAPAQLCLSSWACVLIPWRMSSRATQRRCWLWTPLRTTGVETNFPRQKSQPPACLVDGEVDVSAIWGHSLDRGQCLSPHNICGGILSEEPLQGGTAQGHT